MEGKSRVPPGKGGRPPARGSSRGSSRHPESRGGAQQPTEAEKQKAAELAKRSGIPPALAIRVVRGLTTMNEVLQEMWVLEKRDKLVREGMDPSLAGQVARGRLQADRARRVQAIWAAQHAPFKSDVLKRMPAGTPAGLSLFGDGLLREGRILDVTRYDFVFQEDGAEAARSVRKHLLKFYCRPEDLEAVRGCAGRDGEVAGLGLSASEHLSDRFRPKQGTALAWVSGRKPVRLVLRDGDTITGVPVRVALFEIDLAVGESARVSVLTHALFKERPFEFPG